MTDDTPESHCVTPASLPEPPHLDRPVVAAVLTYRRPALLEALLPQLVAQVASLGELPEGSGVLVVDNDPDASARDLCARHSGVRYAHEPIPGIAAARQRALDTVPPNALMAFLDDDEVPCPGWLLLLVHTWATWAHPAAVRGHVLVKYDSPPEQWILDGGFFVRQSYPTGTEVETGATNNLLIDVQQARDLGARFDTALGLRGGEDTLFTRTLTYHGGRIVWCEESKVLELLPTERISRMWVLKRSFSHGGASARVALRFPKAKGGRVLQRVTLVGGGLLRVPAAGLQYLWGVATRSPRRRARAPWLAARGLGLAAGGLGLGLAEYKRTSGSGPAAGTAGGG